MTFDITHEGRTTLSTDIGTARALGYPDAAIAGALRADAKARMLNEIDGYRVRLSGAQAGIARPGPERIGIWAAKARLAREHSADPDAMPEPFRGHLTREATARGRSLADQLALVIARADTFEALGLLIDAMEAEAEAGIDPVPDADVLAGTLEDVLTGARSQAETAFADALATLAS